MKNNKSNNNVVIALLAVLIVAVLCVGGYFIIRDINKNNDNNSKNGTSQTADNKNNSGSSQSGSSSDSGATGGSTPAPEPVQEELEAGITYAERRGNDFYVEVQVNGAVNGRCDISVVPTSGGEGHHDDDDLEISNKVSICNEDFSLKGMNPGEHRVTVVINTTDGRTKTLDQIVNI